LRLVVRLALGGLGGELSDIEGVEDLRQRTAAEST
jgi:hypothetical protein